MQLHQRFEDLVNVAKETCPDKLLVRDSIPCLEGHVYAEQVCLTSATSVNTLSNRMRCRRCTITIQPKRQPIEFSAKLDSTQDILLSHTLYVLVAVGCGCVFNVGVCSSFGIRAKSALLLYTTRQPHTQR